MQYGYNCGEDANIIVNIYYGVQCALTHIESITGAGKMDIKVDLESINAKLSKANVLQDFIVHA